MTNDNHVAQPYENEKKALWKAASRLVTVAKVYTASSMAATIGIGFFLSSAIGSHSLAEAMPFWAGVVALGTMYWLTRSSGKIMRGVYKRIDPAGVLDEDVNPRAEGVRPAIKDDVCLVRDNITLGGIKLMTSAAGIGGAVALAASKMGAPILQNTTEQMSTGAVVGTSLALVVVGGWAFGSLQKNIKKANHTHKRICDRVVSHCYPS